MAVPRGYRRNSSGFLQPVGRLPSGRVSGPPAGLYGPLGTGDNALKGLSRLEMPATAKENALHKKILAGYEKAEAAHKQVMASITKSQNDTFKRLNDALNKSKESDPKDKLGNTVPSTQTKYLEAQLVNHMASGGMKNAQAATPRAAGITLEQIKGMKGPGGPGGPGGGQFDIGGSDYIPGIPGSRNLLQTPRGSMEPGDPFTSVPLPGGKSLDLPAQPPEVFPMNTKATHRSGAKLTLLGQQRPGPNGPEYLARTEDGREDWVPAASFEVAEDKKDDTAMQTLQRFFAPKYKEDPDRFATL
jgi:hypothetical protein